MLLRYVQFSRWIMDIYFNVKRERLEAIINLQSVMLVLPSADVNGGAMLG